MNYVAVNSYQMAQSNTMNVQEPPPPVGVSVDTPGKMTFYINGAGHVRALLPLDIEVMPLQHFRNQLAMTTNVPTQNGAYLGGQVSPLGNQYPPPPQYRWPLPFPVLAPQNRPQQVVPYDRYYNGNTPSRVGKNNAFHIPFTDIKILCHFAYAKHSKTMRT